jgi:hypothetical protein
MKRLLITLTLIVLATSAATCACWKTENKHRPACVFADNVLDCLKPELKPAMTAAAKLILALIVTPLQVPTGEVIAESLRELEQIVGVDILACAMAKVQDDLASKLSSTDPDDMKLMATDGTKERLQAGLAAAVAWKAKNVPPHVVIKR